MTRNAILVGTAVVGIIGVAAVIAAGRNGRRFSAPTKQDMIERYREMKQKASGKESYPSAIGIHASRHRSLQKRVVDMAETSLDQDEFIRKVRIFVDGWARNDIERAECFIRAGETWAQKKCNFSPIPIALLMKYTPSIFISLMKEGMPAPVSDDSGSPPEGYMAPEEAESISDMFDLDENLDEIEGMLALQFRMAESRSDCLFDLLMFELDKNVTKKHIDVMCYLAGRVEFLYSDIAVPVPAEFVELIDSARKDEDDEDDEGKPEPRDDKAPFNAYIR